MSQGPIQVSLKPDVPDRVVFLVNEYAEMLQVVKGAKLSESSFLHLKHSCLIIVRNL